MYLFLTDICITTILTPRLIQSCSYFTSLSMYLVKSLERRCIDYLRSELNAENATRSIES